MRTEIGSDYWLTMEEYEKALASPPIVEVPVALSDVTFTNLCRTGIELFLEKLNVANGRVLVPEFTCHSVIEPFVHHGFDVFCYAIKDNLDIDVERFTDTVKQIGPHIIVLHSYFGFNTIKANVKELVPDAIIIEDLTQRLLSSFPLIEADAYVGSLRKWFPVPDGGFYSGKLRIEWAENRFDDDYISLELKALLAKGRYITGESDQKEGFRKDFAIARNMLDEGQRIYSMSSISKKICNSVDIATLRSARQVNGRYLVEKLKEFSFLQVPLDDVDDETVPFLIPVFVKEHRKNFQTYLAINNIYATVIWTCPDIIENQISKTGRYVYDHILCFHCDHRYGLDDIQRIYEVIKAYNNE